MTKLSSVRSLAAACLALTGLLGGAGGVFAENAAPTAILNTQNDVLKRDGVWAQAYAGRPADPSVRFGQLANGMRYAIKANATPAKQVSIWMRMGVGSLDEHDDEQGFAHFLEHMAFKGSTHVPAGDMVQILQRLGLEFGPDTNAETSQEQTVYKLNFPANDATSLATGLMLMREIGSELSLSREALEPEKGVVLAEERLRDSPSNQGHIRQQEFLLQGQLAPRRMPIGKREIIASATPEAVRAFYRRAYRPERATVIVVGPVDVDAVEASIRERFGDWMPNGSAESGPDAGSIALRGPSVASFSKPGSPELVSVSWVNPYDATADTSARERRDMAQLIALQVLNRRLAALTEGNDPPFVAAQAWRGNTVRAARLTQVSIQAKAGGWKRAIEATVREQRRLLAEGPATDEIARELAWIRTYLVNQRDGAATRQTPTLADAIVRSVNDDDVFTSPEQDVAEFEAMTDSLGVETVQAAARSLFDGQGPLVFVAGRKPVDGGDEALLGTLREALAAPLEASAARTTLTWPYSPAEHPGTVASRSRVEDLDVTKVTFGNGVRLLVKPTTFARDQVLVAVRAGGGRLDLAKAPRRALWTVAGPSPVLPYGGTRELTFEQIRTLTAGQVVELNFQLDDDAFVLSGTTRPADLDTELQLLAASVDRPGLRPDAFERIRTAVANQVAQLPATPYGVLTQERDSLLHGGDPRWNPVPRPEDLAASTPDDVLSLLAGPLSGGPLEVTIVGDVDAERAIAAVAATLGALPQRPLRAAPGADAEGVSGPPTGGEPLVRTHSGRADQSVAMESWRTADYWADPQAQRVLGVLGEIIDLRLTALFRSGDGSTYSPSVYTTSSDVFKGVGELTVVLELPPAKADAFFKGMEGVAAALREAPPTDDELERAKRPRIETRQRWLQNNAFWLIVLGDAHASDRQFDVLRKVITGLQRVTAADVQDAARRWLDPARAFRLVVVPETAGR